ncbi:hypothetical protein [Gordonia caeni]|uniref:Uncharacterized protein n=1 Tax=Gordonia caeni TaxID=1007097 RepID=A0ABP7PBY8_9ACTN
MDQIQELEPGPDGAGWWPAQFLVDCAWADDRGTSWRAVTNHPTLQARRTGTQLDLRQTDDPTVHTYLLTPTDYDAYLATKEN